MAVGLGLVKKKGEDITVESLQSMFPDKKSTISDKTVELIKECVDNPEFDGYKLLDTMTNYQNVMSKNSASMGQYLDAIKFSSYLESDDSAVNAYVRTFGSRVFVQERRDLESDSVGYRELTSAAARFRKSPMVVDILTQADVPLYLMFQGQRMQMAMVLSNEAMTAAYSKDRIAAADKFLTHVKPPEGMKIELDVGVGGDTVNALDELRKATEKLAIAQSDSIKAGVAVKYIAESAIIDVEVSE